MHQSSESAPNLELYKLVLAFLTFRNLLKGYRKASAKVSKPFWLGCEGSVNKEKFIADNYPVNMGTLVEIYFSTLEQEHLSTWKELCNGQLTAHNALGIRKSRIRTNSRFDDDLWLWFSTFELH